MQLQAYVINKQSWKDLLASSAGETLMEMMSAVGALNQFSIELAARENFLDTAVRESSIYAITRMLGVRIERKIPASVDNAILTRTTSTSLPKTIAKFTQFTINSIPYFNREPIFFAAGSEDSDPFTLYEGTIKVQTFTADSTSFREIYLNEPGFVVSSVDVEVTLIDPATNVAELWSVTQDGIWVAEPTDKVYYDATSGDGDTILAFGDGYHGYLPPTGYKIQVRYAVTQGASGSNGNISNISIVCPTDSTVAAKAGLSGSITGGADQKSAAFYQTMAPQMFKARTRAVTKPDHKAIILDYPGVASVQVQGQKDIAPYDLRFMNVIRICILPTSSDAFTTLQWSDFLEWFQSKQFTALDIQTINPTKVTVNVSFTLVLKLTADPQASKSLADAAIRSLFTKTKTTLGRRLAVSDIVDSAKVDGVDYIEDVLPSGDQVPSDSNTYFALGDLVIGTKYTERT
jgi:hypothetical protein